MATKTAPKKRGRGRPKGSKNKTKQQQIDAAVAAEQQAKPPVKKRRARKTAAEVLTGGENGQGGDRSQQFLTEEIEADMVDKRLEELLRARQKAKKAEAKAKADRLETQQVITDYLWNESVDAYVAQVRDEQGRRLSCKKDGSHRVQFGTVKDGDE